MLPNFLICGVTKGGTTSLYHYLRQHPEICMPAVKELNYFTRAYGRGREWYESHFDGCAGRRAIGEASPSYIWYREAARRIAETIPHARLLFILRNPIDRAYSHYWFDVSRGVRGARRSFPEAIRTTRGYRVYIERGFYVQQLEPFLARFDRSQLHLLLTEALKAEPDETLRRCFEFLDVDPDFRPSVARRHNVTTLPRNAVAAGLLQAWRPLRIGSRSIMSDGVRARLRPLWRRWHETHLASDAPPPMDENLRRDLAGLFADRNRRLSELVGRDLREVWS